MPLGRMKKLLGAAFFTVSVFGFVLDLLLLNHPHLGRGLVWPLLMGAMAAGTLAARIKRTRLYPPIHLILLAVTCLAFILPYVRAPAPSRGRFARSQPPSEQRTVLSCPVRWSKRVRSR